MWTFEVNKEQTDLRLNLAPGAWPRIAARLVRLGC